MNSEGGPFPLPPAAEGAGRIVAGGTSAAKAAHTPAADFAVFGYQTGVEAMHEGVQNRNVGVYRAGRNSQNQNVVFFCQHQVRTRQRGDALKYYF